MDKKEVKTLAEAYCKNPKSHRKSEEGQAELANLPAPVQAKVREILEARRGFRRVNGKIEFSKETLISEIERLSEKKASYAERTKAINARVAELKDELAERFGENNE